MKTMREFCEASNINATLIRAVVRQIGGWTSFKEYAADVAQYGADAGWHGFTYYSDTMSFYAKNQTAITGLVESMAIDLGTDSLSLVEWFNCLRGNVDTGAISKTLWSTKSKHDTQVANALAWFALEEVARSYDGLN